MRQQELDFGRRMEFDEAVRRKNDAAARLTAALRDVRERARDYEEALAAVQRVPDVPVALSEREARAAANMRARIRRAVNIMARSYGEEPRAIWMKAYEMFRRVTGLDVVDVNRREHQFGRPHLDVVEEARLLPKFFATLCAVPRGAFESLP